MAPVLPSRKARIIHIPRCALQQLFVWHCFQHLFIVPFYRPLNRCQVQVNFGHFPFPCYYLALYFLYSFSVNMTLWSRAIPSAMVAVREALLKLSQRYMAGELTGSCGVRLFVSGFAKSLCIGDNGSKLKLD